MSEGASRREGRLVNPSGRRDNLVLMLHRVRFFASRLFGVLLVLSPSLTALPGETTLSADRGKAEAARAILDRWHAADPLPGKRVVHVVCWRTRDRDFPEAYRERLPRILEHIRRFYADEMERNGFGRRTFGLDRDDSGQVRIHRATGDGDFLDYGGPDGQRIRKDCAAVLREAGIDAERETILIFTNLAEWDPEEGTFTHRSPYYAGGSHRAGTAWQLDSPQLDPRHLPLKAPLIRDGQYGRISLGKHNSIFIGGIAHEMGHAFSLPHNRARLDEAAAYGTALMGAGNLTYFEELRGEGKGSFLTFAHALRLASQPLFSGSVKGMNLPVRAEFRDLRVALAESGFVLTGRVESSLPAYGLVGYLDPEGGSDYNARTVAAVPGPDGSFVLRADALVPGKAADLRLVACLVNGATSTWRTTYRVGADGAVDISAMQVALELRPFAQALRANDRLRAEALLSRLDPGSMERRVADAIFRGKFFPGEVLSAGDVPADRGTYPLSRVRTEEASVGWGRPAFDHLPGPEPLLVSGGEIFETGIYAHAASRFRFDLSAGNWEKLRGKCGLPSRPGGSVVFVIRADDREVFRSPRTGSGQLHAYEIDLRGVKSLELLVEDAGDGESGDWGLWLEPTLQRPVVSQEGARPAR